MTFYPNNKNKRTRFTNSTHNRNAQQTIASKHSNWQKVEGWQSHAMEMLEITYLPSVAYMPIDHTTNTRQPHISTIHIALC